MAIAKPVTELAPSTPTVIDAVALDSEVDATVSQMANAPVIVPENPSGTAASMLPVVRMALIGKLKCS
jgi:hypothetical protein